MSSTPDPNPPPADAGTPPPAPDPEALEIVREDHVRPRDGRGEIPEPPDEPEPGDERLPAG